MKCQLITYMHRENGLSLFVVPETDAERRLLEGLWSHGQMEKGNGIADESGMGFCINWSMRKDTK